VSDRSLPAIAPRQLGAYFGLLLLTLGLAEPTGLVNLPLLFWLKDGLHMKPEAIAVFEAVALAPGYFVFVFGFMRDRWKPFGGSDRGYFILTAPLAIAVYCLLPATNMSWSLLLVGMLALVIAFESLGATTEALMTTAAQRLVMPGRLSAVSELGEMLPSVASMLIGGWLAIHAGLRLTLLLGATLTLFLLIQSLAAPPIVFASRQATEREGNGQALRRLVRHPGLWPVLAILLVWNFSPGWGTPLLFFLSDRVKLSPEVFGAVRAAWFASSAFAAFVYAFMCRRWPLRRTLFWSVALNILPGFLILLAHTGAAAIGAAVIIGMLLGVGNIALFDLLRRACPTDLEGSGTMLGYSVFAIGGAAGDLAGAFLYERVGFTMCLVIDAVTTAAILPVVLVLPRHLVSWRDGERIVIVPDRQASDGCEPVLVPALAPAQPRDSTTGRVPTPV